MNSETLWISSQINLVYDSFFLYDLNIKSFLWQRMIFYSDWNQYIDINFIWNRKLILIWNLARPRSGIAKTLGVGSRPFEWFRCFYFLKLLRFHAFFGEEFNFLIGCDPSKYIKSHFKVFSELFIFENA